MQLIGIFHNGWDRLRTYVRFVRTSGVGASVGGKCLLVWPDKHEPPLVHFADMRIGETDHVQRNAL